MFMMELTRKQFDILELLVEGPCSQRRIREKTGLSLGTVNRTMKELSDVGFVSDGIITAEGKSALEPYRVRRAIFIAAGFGTRLVPITLNTPKPLVRVHGTSRTLQLVS
jgi:DNA-binding Lrp family transcriptional regulator